MELKNTFKSITAKVKQFNLFDKIKKLFLSAKKNKYVTFIFFLLFCINYFEFFRTDFSFIPNHCHLKQKGCEITAS